MSLAREVLIGFAVLIDLLAAKWRMGGGDRSGGRGSHGGGTKTMEGGGEEGTDVGYAKEVESAGHGAWWTEERGRGRKW